ncbi:MAG: hypothetical protein ACJ76A_05490 [Actinomycetota bacterium]|jgi:hypothetical protein
MDRRWLAFRDQAGAVLNTPLRSSLPIGLNWRGGFLIGSQEITALDEIARSTADQAGAAVAMWETPTFTYGVASRRDHEEVPFLLGVAPTAIPDEATDAVARCGIGPSYAAWRQHTAQALAAWSVQTPRTPDALEVDAVLQLADDAVEAWCRLFGMAVPVERELTPEDQAAMARAALAEAAERRRKRRSVDVAW